MSTHTEQDRTAEQAARLDRIHRLARAQLDQGEDREVMEALVLLAHLRLGRGEEALWSLQIISRDVARQLGGEDGEPVYPCHEWTGELLCVSSAATWRARGGPMTTWTPDAGSDGRS